MAERPLVFLSVLLLTAFTLLLAPAIALQDQKTFNVQPLVQFNGNNRTGNCCSRCCNFSSNGTCIGCCIFTTITPVSPACCTRCCFSFFGYCFSCCP